ncbi:MAG TPA: GMC family oxidoreductase, partial [Anaerolineae bacterium]|nr:GMC family oxidoreductase [Anaerolineae bacterium]
RTLDGVAVDWPLAYEELEPYYEQMEREYPVAGPAHFPWGKPHGYPYGPLEVSTHGHKLVEACLKLGIPVVVGGPVGINAGAFGKRPHCIFRGQCHLGCKVGAKHSTLVSHIPNAITHGAEVRTRCMAFEVPVNEGSLATGVRYYRSDHDGAYREEFQRARLVIVAGYAVETPRLLLNSTSSRFPQGLANSSGLVGKFLMTQASHIAIGRYSEMIRQYKGPPAQVDSEEFYETDPSRGFARGFCIQTVAPLPISMAKMLAEARGLYGMELRRAMADYNHYACFGILGELLPDERNYVALAQEKDRFGIPVAYVHYNLFENDKRLIEYALGKVIELHHAVGAEDIIVIDDSAHLIGTCRMGFTPQDSVVDQWCRSWDVPNLFIPDGSCLPTQGAANPALTISAIAARTADYIRKAANGREL